ncbi:MAG: hypothetical protein NTZ19_00730 [Bacteroidetes bacterium]|nr:hypothetical protein [Bacteroidota bacterium]
MIIPSFRPKSINEIYFQEPTILEIIKPSVPSNDLLANGGILISTPVVPASPTDISSPVLSNPSFIHSAGRFLYQYRVPIIIILIAGTYYYTAIYTKRKTEKEQKKPAN